MRLALPDGTSEAVDSTQYRAYQTVAEQFGAGQNGPLLVVAQTPDAVAEADQLRTQVEVAAVLAEQSDVVAVAPVAWVTPVTPVAWDERKVRRRRGHRLLRRRQALAAPTGRLRPGRVEEPAPRHGDQPGPGIAWRVGGPAAQGLDEGVLHGVLGRGEVGSAADEDADHLRDERPQVQAGR